MGLTFKDNRLIIGSTEWAYAPFRFSKILKIGSGVTPTWQDIIMSGTNSLTLLNAKADGLNYLKLYGGCKKDFTPISMNYETVYNMQHSTFDISKFTVVGTPTISTDGIASGFNNANYIKAIDVLDTSQPFIIESPVFSQDLIDNDAHYIFQTWINYSSQGLRAFVQGNNLGLYYKLSGQTSYSSISSSNIITANVKYQMRIEYTGTLYYVKWRNVDTNSEWYDIGTINNSAQLEGDNSQIWLGYHNSNPYGFVNGSLDLKQFSITVDNAPVFSGNQTGTDTYTVNGSTVSIPYTLSSTGDKIVDNIYLTRVQSVIENLDTSTYIVINNSNDTATDYRARILCNNGILKVNIQGEIYADGTLETVKDSLNNIATVENLFAVGTIKDVQDVLTGTITRNCEAVYYDGTQTINTPYISTTGGLDVGAIIVHPRTIPTTETVTPQTLTVQTGTNTIEITQASIDDLPLEVSYKAGVTVTITEIENANVDNSVTVTIS